MQRQCQRAERDDDIEDPAPAQVVGQSAAEDRSENRRNDYARAEEGQGLTAISWRKRFEHDGLGERLHYAARSALDDSERDQGRQIGRHAAQHRGRREGADRQKQQPPAADVVRQPPGD
jgi:hypothetical protein